MSDDITGDLDLLGDWLDAKGYTEEAGLCTRAMDEINKLRAENEKLREALNWFLNGAVPLGGLTRYEYEFVVEARKRAAALKESGDE